MKRTHLLKTWPSVFPDIDSGAKTVEIRRNDRDFRVGDHLALLEYDPDARTVNDDQIEVVGRYTGRTCERLITHVLPGGQFGLEPGFVALSLRPATEAKGQDEGPRVWYEGDLEPNDVIAVRDHQGVQWTYSNLWIAPGNRRACWSTLVSQLGPLTEVRPATSEGTDPERAEPPRDAKCGACGRPFWPDHTVTAPGPTVKHPFRLTKAFGRDGTEEQR